ncbi:hypothetical protein [Mesorhizobium sp. 128a]
MPTGNRNTTSCSGVKHVGAGRVRRTGEGGAHGDREPHGHQAAFEIDREAALPLTADEALPQTKEITGTDVLPVEELAVRTGMSGDEARALVDRLGTERAAIGQKRQGRGAISARLITAKRRRSMSGRCSISSGIEEVVAIAIHCCGHSIGGVHSL